VRQSPRVPFRVCAAAAAFVWVAVAPCHDARAAGSSPADAAACVQASDQGQSQRDEGKYRDARESFLQCSRDVCPAVVLKSCASWLRDLDQLVPTLVLGAKDEHGNDIADVKVTFDGEPFATRLDGKPIPVDGGEHVLRFERDGSAPVEQKVIVRAGEKSRIVSAVMKPVGSGEVTTPETPEQAPPPPEKLLSPRHVTSAALLLAGLGAAGTGVVFTLLANSAGSSATSLAMGKGNMTCNATPPPSFCSTLSSDASTQHTDAGIATDLFIAGGAAALGAVGTWLFWPKGKASSSPTSGNNLMVSPLPGGAALSFRGSFL